MMPSVETWPTFFGKRAASSQKAARTSHEGSFMKEIRNGRRKLRVLSLPKQSAKVHMLLSKVILTSLHMAEVSSASSCPAAPPPPASASSPGIMGERTGLYSNSALTTRCTASLIRFHWTSKASTSTAAEDDEAACDAPSAPFLPGLPCLGVGGIGSGGIPGSAKPPPLAAPPSPPLAGAASVWCAAATATSAKRIACLASAPMLRATARSTTGSPLMSIIDDSS
mmetsp:Transcript_165622/g.531635  ORF Transcript_165622/g.531635 Transcript_165622/m.531635 type:complete len:225 (-) Transcript_165622:2023-2697(-)